jgi:hypothetical protein
MATPWHAWFQFGFLFGAAAAGFQFGPFGDLAGSARALGISIVCFSAFTVLSWDAQSPRNFSSSASSPALGSLPSSAAGAA